MAAHVEAGELPAEFLTLRELGLDVKIRLSDPLDIPNTDSARSLLAISNARGVLIAATSSGFVVAGLAELRAEYASAKRSTRPQLSQPRCSIELASVIPDAADAAVAFVKIADSESKLVVGLTDGRIAIWELAALASSEQSAPSQVVSPPAPNVRLLEVCPNPEGFPHMCAVVYAPAQSTSSHTLESGNVYILDVHSGQWSSELIAKCTALCWSVRGKRLAAGLASGELKQLTPEGEVKDALPPPPELSEQGAHYIEDVLWVENDVYVVAYNVPTSDDPTQPEHQDELYILLRDLKNVSQPIKYVKLPMDPAPPFGNADRSGRRFSAWLRNWTPMKHIIFSASVPSTDVGALGCTLGESGPEAWKLLELEETSRPVLPLSSSDEALDTSPFGLALDLTAVDEVDDPTAAARGDEGAKVPPAPILYIYTNDGVLLAYHVINTEAGAGKYPGVVGAPSDQLPAPTPSVSQEKTPTTSTKEPVAASKSDDVLTSTSQAPASEPASTTPAEPNATPTKPPGSAFSFGGFGVSTGTTSAFGATKPSAGFSFGTGFSSTTTASPVFGSSAPSSDAPKPTSSPFSFTTASTGSAFGFPSSSTSSTAAPKTVPDEDEEDKDKGSSSLSFGGWSDGNVFSALSSKDNEAKDDDKDDMSSSAGTPPASTPPAPQSNGGPKSSTGFSFGSSNDAPTGVAAFGKPTAFGSSTSSATPSPGASAFGTPGATSTASAFGKPSAFGQTASTSPAPAFGSVSAFGSSTGPVSAFGKVSAFGAASTPSPFGKSTTTSAFGSATTPSPFGKAAPAPAFGTASPFGKAAAGPAFGQASAFGTPSSTTSAFGSTSAFGASASPSTPKSAFGASASSPGPSAFAAAAKAPSAFSFAASKEGGSAFATAAKQGGSSIFGPKTGAADTASEPKNSAFSFGASRSDAKPAEEKKEDVSTSIADSAAPTPVKTPVEEGDKIEDEGRSLAKETPRSPDLQSKTELQSATPPAATTSKPTPAFSFAKPTTTSAFSSASTPTFATSNDKASQIDGQAKASSSPLALSSDTASAETSLASPNVKKEPAPPAFSFQKPAQDKLPAASNANLTDGKPSTLGFGRSTPAASSTKDVQKSAAFSFSPSISSPAASEIKTEPKPAVFSFNKPDKDVTTPASSSAAPSPPTFSFQPAAAASAPVAPPPTTKRNDPLVAASASKAEAKVAPEPVTGIAAEAERVYLMMEDELAGLQRDAEACDGLLEESKTPRRLAQTIKDVEHHNKWSLGDLPLLLRMASDLRKDAESLKASEVDLRTQLLTLQDQQLKAEVKREEVSRFIKARDDPLIAKQLEVQGLGPEHQDNQARLRKGIRSLRQKMAELEQMLTQLKVKITNDKAGKPLFEAPPLDTMQRATRNITRRLLEQLEMLSLLESEARLAKPELHRAESSDEDADGWSTRRSAVKTSKSARDPFLPPPANPLALQLQASNRRVRNMKAVFVNALKEPILNTKAVKAADETIFDDGPTPHVTLAKAPVYISNVPKPSKASRTMLYGSPPISSGKDRQVADMPNLSLPAAVNGTSARSTSPIAAPQTSSSPNKLTTTATVTPSFPALSFKAPALNFGSAELPAFLPPSADKDTFAPGSRESVSGGVRGLGKPKSRPRAAVQLPALSGAFGTPSQEGQNTAAAAGSTGVSASANRSSSTATAPSDFFAFPPPAKSSPVSGASSGAFMAPSSFFSKPMGPPTSTSSSLPPPQFNFGSASSGIGAASGGNGGVTTERPLFDFSRPALPRIQKASREEEENDLAEDEDDVEPIAATARKADADEGDVTRSSDDTDPEDEGVGTDVSDEDGNGEEEQGADDDDEEQDAEEDEQDVEEEIDEEDKYDEDQYDEDEDSDWQPDHNEVEDEEEGLSAVEEDEEEEEAQ